MHTRIVISLALGLALLSAAATARADEPSSRAGFVVGGGLGAGLASIKVDGATGSDTRIGAATDLQLGWGLSRQLLVFAYSKIIWFQQADELTFTEVAGLGGTYYLHDSAPTLFVSAGLGWSVFTQPGGPIDTQLGFGTFVGAGYEPRPHWNLQVDLGWNNPGDFQTAMAMAKVTFLYY